MCRLALGTGLGTVQGGCGAGAARGTSHSVPSQNYLSCHSSSPHNPLRWPNVQYQILGGQTDNKIIFKQRNGIYIFQLSILDPYYR